MSLSSLRKLLLICFCVCPSVTGQTITRQNLATILGFENATPGQPPAGWSISGGGSVTTDGQVAHGGKNSARIERNASSTGTITTIIASLPVDFTAGAVEWRGFIKLDNVTDFVALWLREDDSQGSVAFATLQDQNIHGTADWKEYAVQIKLVPGRQVVFGFFLAGAGTAWVDDLQLLADGKPVAEAPSIPLPAIQTDKEFDAGSRISLNSLSDLQVKNLATAAKVWGFLKYHHPAVTAGKVHWDYELFRVLPQVIAAESAAAANTALLDWINKLGPIDECSSCAGFDGSDIALGPDLAWVLDESVLGPRLSDKLKSVYWNRTPRREQFYVRPVPGVSNPIFDNELTYAAVRFPDSGYQILALFRLWNIIQYFNPNRETMSDDPEASARYWHEVLDDFIAPVALSKNTTEYQQTLIRLMAKVNDTHANLWSSLAVRPPMGACYLPVALRWAQGRLAVWRYLSDTAGPASGFELGDVIEQLDGKPVEALIAEWRPMYADSNDAARMRDIASYITRGACGSVSVVVRRNQEAVTIAGTRLQTNALDMTRASTHDLPGPTFQLAAPDIAYLKLSSVKVADCPAYIRDAAGTKGLIIDIRNYPSEFVVFSLGSLLVGKETPFVRFTLPDMTNPGAFRWTDPLTITPQQPHYAGKVVILVDEITQSQAEYTTMAFRTVPGATVIGSTTAGADGNVSTILFPWGLSAYVSGIGVFYPDKSPTQRIGIIPDRELRPTVEGIRAGKDELVEEAIRVIRGSVN